MSFEAHQHLIIIKGEPRTLDVHFCQRQADGSFMVEFKGSRKQYKYNSSNFEWLSDPHVFDHNRYVLRTLNGDVPILWPDTVDYLAFFKSRRSGYWYVECPEHPNGLLFHEEEVKLVDVTEKPIEPKQNVFKYLTDVAAIDELKFEDSDCALLGKYYASIQSIPDDRAINAYLNKDTFPLQQEPKLPIGGFIYPFGLNQSQREAVEAAFTNRLSVIQGPPGTGKTQTILNILANLLLQGKTAMVVSNNNTATANIKEKLQKYGLDFLAAFMGNRENVENFLSGQESLLLPSMDNWGLTQHEALELEKALRQCYRHLDDLFTKSELLVRARQELEALRTEEANFLKACPAPAVMLTPRSWVVPDEFPDYLMGLWTEKAEESSERNWLGRFFFKLRCLMKMKISGHLPGISFFNLPSNDFIRVLQLNFYRTKIDFLKGQITSLKKAVAAHEPKKIYKTIESVSLTLLKNAIYQQQRRIKREQFSAQALYHNPEKFLKQYPIVLSTTFSSRNTFNGQARFDYVIMDEASQVPIVTGALALTCASNAVIVGDKRQLVNVVTEASKSALNQIFANYELAEGYNSAENSFLDSIIKVLPDIKQTLLREHYRCSPRIINFCNKKFYGGELLVMTEENSQIKNPIFAVRTVEGNHARGLMNQREVDVLLEEVLPKLHRTNDLAVIAPYNNHVNAVKAVLPEGFDASTVHKYQGREKDAVVLSCVDNEATEFNDDAHLINVAVSRAKKQFCLLVTGNELKPNSNLGDLLDYIAYENGEIQNSKVQSIFDYLYKQYGESRLQYLKNKRRVSEFDSENLTYALLKDVVETNEPFRFLDILCHYPLSGLLRDTDLLTNEEANYALSPFTHVDFLITNKVSHKPVLVIETDGHRYHAQDEVQSSRDRKKDAILAKYGIPILRLTTTGSNEQQKVVAKLIELIG